jgi:hypothetical protein
MTTKKTFKKAPIAEAVEKKVLTEADALADLEGRPRPVENQPVPISDDLSIKLTLPLGTVNYLLATLDKNPLGGSVMQVANAIANIKAQAEAQVKEATQPKK